MLVRFVAREALEKWRFSYPSCTLRGASGFGVLCCPFSSSAAVTKYASPYNRPTARFVQRKLGSVVSPRNAALLDSFGKKNKVACCFGTSPSPDKLEQGRLIYVGNLGKAVLGVKFFSYSSSTFSLCVMPYILYKTGIGVHSIALQAAFCSVVGFFTFITPVALHLITKGYVVRLYHNKETDSYTAITYSALLTEKKTVFHQKDVTIPGVSKMFTTFYAKKRSMLVNPMLFPHAVDYNHLLGYDKPFSFDLEELNGPSKNQ